MFAGSHHEVSRVVALPHGPDMLQVVSDAPAQTEITLLSPNPIEATINDAHSGFRSQDRHPREGHLRARCVSTRKTVASGQALDVSLLFAPFPEALKTGNIDPKSATVIGRLRLAIGVRKGSPKPDISTPDAVRRMLRNAKSIVSVGSGTGSVGGAVLLTLDKLGITPELKPKIRWRRPAVSCRTRWRKASTR